jgi:FMN phosphatase YigB (HAD superfamily)
VVCDWLGVLTGSPDDGEQGLWLVDAVSALHRTGVRTAVLSNAEPQEWPAGLFDGVFDAVLLSGITGLRKPDPAAFRHAAAVLGVAPGECVFIDDALSHVRAAVEVGLVGVHHTSTSGTVTELEALFPSAGLLRAEQK